MSIYLLALLLGVATGLRSMAPIAAVSWAAHLGWLHLENTWLAFLGATITPWILSALALGELVTDKLPTTPSRKVPIQFGGRMAVGAFAGMAMVATSQNWIVGAAAGLIGAIIGTLAGAEVRGRLAAAVGRDLPIALLEDVIAIGSSILIVSRLA